MAQTGAARARVRTHSAVPSPSAAHEELLARIELALVARRLHDDLGPTLCAAGFHLEVVRAAAETAETKGAVSGLQAAMAHATEAVRSLSYATDPDVVRRCGLPTALRYLAKSTESAFESEEVVEFSPEQSEILFRFARVVVAQMTAARLAAAPSLRLGVDSLEIGVPSPLPQEVLAALESLLARCGIGLTVKELQLKASLESAP
jgi:hypothetical protein